MNIKKGRNIEHMINIEYIEKLLQKQNKTIYRLSKITSIDETGLRNIISGKIKNPHINTVYKIAKALKVSVDDLLLDEYK